MSIKQKEKFRAFLKLKYRGDDFVDLGEFESSFNDIKKFLKDNIDVLITKDKKVINKYVSAINRRDKAIIESLREKANNPVISKIQGFGNEEE